jgi:UDP-2-acetamido-3-amino-2,3-dideoxy-glucuronate N-acetyltransferase
MSTHQRARKGAGPAAYIHPQALIDTPEIGAGTRVWAFTHVLKGARIGRDCNIGEQCYIESGAIVGDRVTVKHHTAIWDGVHIADDVFVGPSVAFTNDRRPRSRQQDWVLEQTHIEQGATLGAHVTVLCGVRVGAYAFIGAGTVVTKDVPPYRLVTGRPARGHRWVCQCAHDMVFRQGTATCSACGKRYTKRGQVIQLAAVRRQR